MNPMNTILSRFGLQLSRTGQALPREFRADYERYLAELTKNPRGFQISRAPRYDVGSHPVTYRDYECAFAAHHVARLNPQRILDVGSYRHFIWGLLSHYQVTTIDVRARRAVTSNEVVVTCDAKKLDLPDDTFDVVISLCALEHFGLGRYGDEYDLDADSKSFEEMIRVLKPAGRLVFTTTISGARPFIAFNAHRIYSHAMIRAFCKDLVCEEEKCYSHRLGDFCSLDQVTQEPNTWDAYCGCWRKDTRDQGANERI